MTSCRVVVRAAVWVRHDASEPVLGVVGIAPRIGATAGHALHFMGAPAVSETGASVGGVHYADTG